MSAAIEIRGLSKRFGAVRAVDGLSLEVPEGSLFGFLGPNGAGKTTTIRSLLGLVCPDAGEMTLLGEPVPRGLPSIRRRIGAIVEGPRLWPPLSARRNLEVVAGMLGGIPPGRVDEVLRLVGLDSVADRSFGTYSTGMRQRLGLAAALLPQPELLLLDEPSGGLDPAGQRDLRAFLSSLREQGTTIFVSSHLLAEVEQTCDRVAIIDRGRLVRTGRTAELLSIPRTYAVRVPESDLPRATALLDGRGPQPDGSLLVETADPSLVTRTLADEGIYLSELRAVRIGLEELFLQLTEEDGP